MVDVLSALMIDYECPLCGRHGLVATPEQLSDLCHVCQAQAAWAQLPASTWELVGEHLAHKRIVQAIMALRTAHPSIALREAIDLVNYRETRSNER